MSTPKGFTHSPETIAKMKAAQIERRRYQRMTDEEKKTRKEAREFVLVGGRKMRRPDASPGCKVLSVEEWKAERVQEISSEG